ncbi:MAG TPA: DUF3857 domain-containing protein [Chitinophagaceae bacterium]|nr:DUF3857 domain-containing protein [Chitinophagaceae bacterium]
MRKIFSATLALCACAFCVTHAQEKLPEFGRVKMNDMQLKECPFEKGADAMYLLKTENIIYEQASLTDTGRLTTEFGRRIKIFNEKGFKNASIIIPYISVDGSTEITDVEATIYNLDDRGKITSQKLDKSQVIYQGADSGTAVNKVSFTFPNLKAGSIVEYRYTKVDKRILFVEPKLLEDNIPTLHYRIDVTVPGDFAKFYYHIAGNLPDEKGDHVKTYYTPGENLETKSFTFFNISSFKLEPLMTSVIDNLARINMSFNSKSSPLNGTPVQIWKYYNYRLLEAPFFGRQFRQRIEAIVPFMDSLKQVTDTLQKIKAIYSYIKQNIQWNGQQAFFSFSLDSCWKNKLGNSAEMNISLLNMLRKIRVTCYPLLISTRNHGTPDKQFPDLAQFNGVDVLVIFGNMAYVLDCTQKGVSFKTPPLNVLYRNAYLVDPEIERWITITASDALLNEDASIDATLNNGGILTGKAFINFTNLAKVDELSRKGTQPDADEERAITRTREPDFTVDSASLIHEDDDNDTLVEKVKFHYTLSNTGDIYFFNPFSLSLFRKNLFTDSVRTTNIDFGCNQSFGELMNLTLPANFSADDLPADKAVATADSGIVFMRSYYKNAAGLHASLTFKINKPLFLKEEYPSVKDFFSKMYGLLNEEILLRRTGN